MAYSFQMEDKRASWEHYYSNKLDFEYKLYWLELHLHLSLNNRVDLQFKLNLNYKKIKTS
jgi:hypothetical protein